ncbi:MAG: DUF1353 domain-containing protein [Gemmatimonadota bacterium]|nr:MAG: DUF1353 domain-containing protein [Gemmatimonadota bacterium]
MLSLLALLVHVAIPVPHASDGEFIGRVVVEWLTEEDADRTMRLVEDFAFRDPDGRVWKVPAGTEVDGASIPETLYSIIGPPFVGDYRRASVVHDHFCQERTEDWRAVHRMFYDAARAGGVPLPLAKAMYAAVRGWGPRWEARVTRDGAARIISIPRPTAEISELQDLGAWIAEADPTLEEIDRHVTALLEGTEGDSAS